MTDDLAFVTLKMDRLFRKKSFSFIFIKYDRIDWDRFCTYSELAEANGWKIILNARDAYFYHLLNEDTAWDTMQSPEFSVNVKKFVWIIKWASFLCFIIFF